MNKNIIFIITITALLLLIGCQEKREVQVTGESDFEIDPDEVEITIAVETENNDAKLAQQENARITQNTIDELKSITNLEMETLNYNIYQEQRYNPKTGKYEKGNYKATNTIRVTSKNLELAGDIIDAAVIAGATRIQYINFQLSEEKQQEQDQLALQKAGIDAKTKAENIAKGLGLELGKIKTVQESNTYYRPYMLEAYAEKAVGDAAEQIAVTPILPNKVNVNARIAVIYSIK